MLASFVVVEKLNRNVGDLYHSFCDCDICCVACRCASFVM